MNIIHRLEPLFWLLFGAGGAVAAIFLPGLFFCVAIAAPLGWIGPEAISHHRIYGLVANPIGRLLLPVVISLTFWHAAHHLRHFALDLGLRAIETPITYALYGLALLGTAAAFGTIAAL